MRVTDSNVLWCIANNENDDDIKMYQEDIAEVIEYENRVIRMLTLIADVLKTLRELLEVIQAM